MKNLVFASVFALLTGCLADRHTAVKATVTAKQTLFQPKPWFLYEYTTEDGTKLEFLTKKKREVGDVDNVLPCYAKKIWNPKLISTSLKN